MLSEAKHLESEILRLDKTEAQNDGCHEPSTMTKDNNLRSQI